MNSSSSTRTPCRYCNKATTTITDIVRLHPCGCTVCKDCWIECLAETVTEMRLTSSSSGSTFVGCRACGSDVESHHYQKQPVLGNDGSLLLTEAVDFDYSKQKGQQSPPVLPPLPVPVVPETPTVITDGAIATTTAATLAAADQNATATASIPTNATTAENEITNSTIPVEMSLDEPGDEPPDDNNTLDSDLNGNGTVDEEEVTTIAADLNENGTTDEEAAAAATTAATSEPTSILPPHFAFKRNRQRNKSFDERFQDLLEYKEKHGHVRLSYRTPGNQSLGEWVKNVRCGKIKIDTKQRQRLNKIGFIWETKQNRDERLWYEMLEKLKRYKEEHGDCRVRIGVDRKLYEWVNTQRKMKNKNALKQYRIEALEALGMIWSTPKSQLLSSTAAVANTTGVSSNEHHDGAGDNTQNEYTSIDIDQRSFSNINQYYDVHHYN